MNIAQTVTGVSLDDKRHISGYIEEKAPVFQRENRFESSRCLLYTRLE